MMPHYVYRLYDTDDELLYVGCTEDLERRLYGHRCLGSRSVLFAHRITRVESVEYPTQEEALAAERAAIEDEYPTFNVIYRRPTPPTEEERRRNRELAYALAGWAPPESVAAQAASLALSPALPELET